MERSKIFDSLKFILICLVVIGHVIERNVDINQPKLIVFILIYSFHMPLFIFISGFFSKTITFPKFRKGFFALFSTYILFQTLNSIPSMLQNKFDFVSYLIKPTGVLWYIICLIMWRFIFCFISKYKLPFVQVFVTSLIIALGVNFIVTNFPILRLFTFFPYFVLGYYCPLNIVEKIRNINKKYTIAILATITTMVCFTASTWFMLTLFTDVPYEYYPEGYYSVFYRIGAYLLAIVMSICMINLSSERFYRLGSKTLIIYLIHTFYIRLIYNQILEHYSIEAWIGVDFLVSGAIICIGLYISSLKIEPYLTNPMLIFQKIINVSSK